MSMEHMNLDKLNEFLKKEGKRGASVVSALGKLNKYLEVMATPIGMQMIQREIDRLEVLFQKVYDEDATAQELAEYRYLKTKIEKDINDVANYYNLEKKVIGNADQVAKTR